MISKGKAEKRKEKSSLLLNSDGTYKLTNNRGETTGHWVKSDSTLKFSTPEKFNYQNIIIKMTATELTLYSQDGPASFYSRYKRKKVNN